VSSQGKQADRLAAIAGLGEPLRRGIYLFVASQAGAVNRDQAAEHFGVSRSVAAFHLDKLSKLGLLDVEFKRPPGRRGPGAGRPAKLYRATTPEVAFSVPPREYELAGRLLAEAVTVAQRDGIPVEQALAETARSVGQSLGRLAGHRLGGAPKREQSVSAARQVLSDCAYEPRDDGREIALLNCPFHSLAREYQTLVCGMNLALITGLTDELPDAGLQARLEPVPGQCCVRLTRRPGAPGRPASGGSAQPDPTGGSSAPPVSTRRPPRDRV
jgi:predicted ArsR family transcriptional regulator